jgi:hypothetical protein
MSDKRKEVISPKNEVIVVDDQEKEKKTKPEKGTIEKVKDVIKSKVLDKKPEKAKKEDSDEEEKENILKQESSEVKQRKSEENKSDDLPSNEEAPKSVKKPEVPVEPKISILTKMKLKLSQTKESLKAKIPARPTMPSTEEFKKTVYSKIPARPNLP